MGKIYKNIAKASAGFQLNVKKPLDDRLVVQNKADLDALVNANIAYIGMQVYVVDDQKAYRLIGTPGDENNAEWKLDTAEADASDENISQLITEVQNLKTSTIISCWPKSLQLPRFPLGTFLFVHNDLGSATTVGTAINVFPVYSTATDYNLEFSNVQLADVYNALPGNWVIRTVVAGGFFVQNSKVNTGKIPDTVFIKDLRTPNAVIEVQLFSPVTGKALTYYWEYSVKDGYILQNIPTDQLTFLTHKHISGIGWCPVIMQDNDATDIRDIAILNPETGKFTPLKSIGPVPSADPDFEKDNVDIEEPPSNQDTPINLNGVADCIAVLNLQGVELKNKNGQQCRLYGTDISSNTFVYGNTLQYLYLPETYNNLVINTSACRRTTGLLEVYIPTNTTKIEQYAFAASTSLKLLRNFENSFVRAICYNAFIENDIDKLYLPTKPDLITLYDASIANWYNTSQEKGRHIKTIFVGPTTVLQLATPIGENNNGNSDSSRTELKFGAYGCFYNFTGSNLTAYRNLHTLELVYSTDRLATRDLVCAEQSYLHPFFHTTERFHRGPQLDHSAYYYDYIVAQLEWFLVKYQLNARLTQDGTEIKIPPNSTASAAFPTEFKDLGQGEWNAQIYVDLKTKIEQLSQEFCTKYAEVSGLTEEDQTNINSDLFVCIDKNIINFDIIDFQDSSRPVYAFGTAEKPTIIYNYPS
jgi:hypothetical protein